jgi:SAM-dependent methyltransferase
MGMTSVEVLDAALREVFVCPRCGGSLRLAESNEEAKCEQCLASWPIEDGILHLMAGETAGQESEKELRERIMKEHPPEKEQILKVVGKHHCFKVMYERARRFREMFESDEWILDIGCGTGWYWRGSAGGRLILSDFSLESLRIARLVLGDTVPAVFLWADAQRLPIRGKAICGVWSIQVFQHFPAAVLQRVQAELERVLRDDFMIEIYNLNPAWLHKAIYRLTGRRLHCRGRLGDFELNRLSNNEWRTIWQAFRAEDTKITGGYSELFFHPDFHLFWSQGYPSGLERVLTDNLPWLASIFARQGQLRISARATR